jgi:cupin fold WbuC family metalloprotein
METIRVDGALLDALTESARTNERRRMNKNLHKMEDPIHRLLNAMEPDSYVQPHRHLAAPRTETLLCVRGRGAIVVFGDDGSMDERFVLAPDGPDFVAELPPGTWHSLLALEPGTVFFEVKAGPYVALEEDDIASWAPAPKDPGVADYLARMRAYAEGEPARA